MWQYKLSVTSWTYGAFFSVSFHRCHPSRCQSPARCLEWLMGLADPIFCIALMSLVSWLLELILTWAYEIAMLPVLFCRLLYMWAVLLLYWKPLFLDCWNLFVFMQSKTCVYLNSVYVFKCVVIWFWHALSLTNPDSSFIFQNAKNLTILEECLLVCFVLEFRFL